MAQLPTKCPRRDSAGPLQFQIGAAMVVGAPILPPAEVGEKCAQCDGCLDAFGDHAVSCRKNGITKRHNAIQDWLLSTARAAGLTCTKEAALPNTERPGDVLLHNWGGQGPLAVDVTCVHPLRPSEGRPTPEAVRKALETEETNKRTKYNQKCADVGWRFQPLAIHTFAGCTPEGAQVLHRLGRLYAESTTIRPTKAGRITHFWNSFTVTVLREVTQQLRLTTYTGPQAPMIQQTWTLDSWGNELRPIMDPKGKRPRTQQHDPYTPC